MLTNTTIAKLLRQVSAAYTIIGENRFKIMAYDRAAQAVDHATSELKDLWDDGRLEDLPAIGKSLTGHLNELFKTGKVNGWEKVFAKIPPAVFPLLDLPGLGPKKAHQLAVKLKLPVKKPIEALEKAANEHKISPLENFGYKSESDILESIDLWRRGLVRENRILLSQARNFAHEIIIFMQSCPAVLKIEVLGSLRRQVVTVGDLDFAVATQKPETVIQHFLSYPSKTQIMESGTTGASLLLTSGRQADLRVCPPNQWGSMLQYFTGSKQHNIKLREHARKNGYLLNEYGINSRTFSTEERLYNFLGLDYIPPELREDTGEIEAALKHQLPRLVELKDIKGDLQMHSDFNQETSHDSGLNSIEELRTFARSLSYQYIGLTNHNPKHDSDSVAKIQKQTEFITRLNHQTPKVLNLLEVDISPSGQLATPDEALNLLDGCLVSIHSSFNMDRKNMTRRVLTALSHPVARIFAHPTGRLLNKREGYELDWEEIFTFCKIHDKALEINAYPDRLDLPDILVREAVKQGVLLSLGTDAHCQEDLNLMSYGVSVARRGWAPKENIINCWNYNNLLKWFRKRG